MSKKLSFIILGSILLLAQGCIFFPAVKGDGNVTTHTIDISDYDQISVDASAAVFNYTQEESAPALTVTVDQTFMTFSISRRMIISLSSALNEKIKHSASVLPNSPLPPIPGS